MSASTHPQPTFNQNEARIIASFIGENTSVDAML